MIMPARHEVIAHLYIGRNAAEMATSKKRRALMPTASVILGLIIGLLTTHAAFSQTYPSKPVRVVVPISAGSGLDIVARAVTQKLAAAWNQPVLVDNRPGAGGTLGTAIVARALPDGHTLLIAGNFHAVNPALYAKLPYDTWQDFAEITSVATLYQVLVVAPSARLKSVPELIARAKETPGRMTFASPGTGTGVHFTGEKFKLSARIDVIHVPYKGGPEAMNDVMTGRVTYWIPSIGTALPFIKSGKLLALGVTSKQRSEHLPDTPTIAESGLADFQHSLWFGVWAPSRTPASILEKIEKDVSSSLTAPDFRAQMKTLVADRMSMTRGEFAKFVRSEHELAVRLMKAAGMTPN
jgi:tripartite-type tricarboxylate transporter receptor subunit TctC